MFLSTVSAFEILTAIQIGDKALSLAQSIPVISILFRDKKAIEPNHSKFFLSFVLQLKNIYNIEDDTKLPQFIRPVGELQGKDITIDTWFVPEMLDENLMLTNQGKFGQKILLIDANVINRQILKTYELISNKSSFANVLLGYLYYFTNYELVLMNGHVKEIEHIDKLLHVFDALLSDSRIIELALSDSKGRLHENLLSIVNTIKHNVKPKLHKQIARKTVKEKLDNTAQNFHLVTYALLNSLLLITEGNVNFHLSLDPNMIQEGFLQTGSQYTWLSKNQIHSITPHNPLKYLLMKGYAAIHNITKDKSSYSRLDVILPSISDIKKYLNDYYKNLDETFIYYSQKQKGADSRETISIYNNNDILNNRAKFIYELASFALNLINSSYVIENILDLLSLNNHWWIFNQHETQDLEQYFHDIEQKMEHQISTLNDFAMNYKLVKANRGITLTSSNEIVKYLTVITTCLNEKIKPKQDIKSLSENKHVTNIQLNHIKRETLLILNEHLQKTSLAQDTVNLQVSNYEKELGDLLYFCTYASEDNIYLETIKNNFEIKTIYELRRSYGIKTPFCELNSFYQQAANNWLISKKNYKHILTDTVKKKHDNFHLNIILNLSEVITNLQNKEPKYSPVYRAYTIHLNYLKYLKNGLLGLLIRKEQVGNTISEPPYEELEEVHYQDYLALKEQKVESKLTLMQTSLDESSMENANLHNIIKKHIFELAKVNKEHEKLQDQIKTMCVSLDESKKEVLEHEETQTILEQHIDKLLDTQIQSIDDCHSEILTLDTLSESLRKIMLNQKVSEETEVILAIYDVIGKFKERMKVKCEALSTNASNILEGFSQLKKGHKLITDVLKKRTEQVLASYRDISIKISEIVKKLEMQSNLLSTISVNIEKAKHEKMMQAARAKEITEQKQKEKVQKKAEARAKKIEEINLLATDNLNPSVESENLPSKNDTKKEINLQSSITASLNNYSSYTTNQFFFYFRMSYRKNKCAKLFESILNNDNLLFEHRLIILNKIIEKIIQDPSLQQFDTGNFHKVIDNIKRSSKDIIINQEHINNNFEIENEVFKYSEDLNNEVNSGFIYDFIFSNRKYCL
tara:strand:- start:47 stop:3316 length:3270 start_codon:yes stop_codon:yes gene_type:complete